MEVYECIRTRRTTREFKPDPVPEEVVYKILQAARWAPSSGNSQPWHFIVITDRDTWGSWPSAFSSSTALG
ncbi:MAG TPA: nitroreductase family protein [Dehalococcoidia bacterium]|nr:nitroreductase family protein [Dehalococcoidia bacterium]